MPRTVQNSSGSSSAQTKSGALRKVKKSTEVRKDLKLPMLEHLMLETLKLRSSRLGSPVKKNVLVRAGIKALAAMSDARLLAVLNTVTSSKKHARPKRLSVST